MKGRVFAAGVLVLYCGALIYILLFKFSFDIRIGHLIFRLGPDAGEANFMPFKTIWSYLSGQSGRGLFASLNIFGNIGLLTPVGFLAPCVSRMVTWQSALGLAIAAGVFLEGAQLVFQLGRFDVDDITLNALGVIIGYCAYIAWMGRRPLAQGRRPLF